MVWDDAGSVRWREMTQAGALGGPADPTDQVGLGAENDPAPWDLQPYQWTPTSPTGFNGDVSSFQFTNPSGFENSETGEIYNQIRTGMGMANAQTPQLGNAAQANASQLSPQMMLGGASISPQMMVDAAQMGSAQDMQAAAQQADLYNALRAQMSGQGPSVAETQAQQQMQAATAAQMAAMGSQRGGALGERGAALAAAQAQQQAAATGALGKSQEAQAAGAQAAGLIGQLRGQSQAFGTTNAQMQQQALLANQAGYNAAALHQADINQQAGLANQQTAYNASNQNASLSQQANLANQGYLNQFMLQQGTMNQQQQQMNNTQFDQMLQYYMQQAQQNVANQITYEQLMAQSQLGLAQTQAGISMNNANNEMGMAGAGVQAGGALLAAGAMAMSDRRAKYGISAAHSSLGDFLSSWREVHP